MDRANFLNILKTLTEAIKCPKCGQAYDINEVQFVEQLDGFCLLQLSCKNCQVPVWVNFFATNNRPDFKIRIAESKLQAEEIDLEPISTDEIIDFHQTIEAFDGDFKKAFRTS